MLESRKALWLLPTVQGHVCKLNGCRCEWLSVSPQWPCVCVNVSLLKNNPLLISCCLSCIFHFLAYVNNNPAQNFFKRYMNILNNTLAFIFHSSMLSANLCNLVFHYLSRKVQYQHAHDIKSCSALFLFLISWLTGGPRHDNMYVHLPPHQKWNMTHWSQRGNDWNGQSERSTCGGVRLQGPAGSAVGDSGGEEQKIQNGWSFFFKEGKKNQSNPAWVQFTLRLCHQGVLSWIKDEQVLSPSHSFWLSLKVKQEDCDGTTACPDLFSLPGEKWAGERWASLNSVFNCRARLHSLENNACSPPKDASKNMCRQLHL